MQNIILLKVKTRGKRDKLLLMEDYLFDFNN
jgi:hypothetical protein